MRVENTIKRETRINNKNNKQNVRFQQRDMLNVNNFEKNLWSWLRLSI